MHTFLSVLFGFGLGLIYCSFTGVEDFKLVQHDAAYYTPTGEFIWADNNKSVH